MGILQVALIALGLFYLLITFYSLIRLIRVIRDRSAIKISIAFYSGMLIASLTRSITLYLIGANKIPKDDDAEKDLIKTLFSLLIIIPDMIGMCVYLFLTWYFYANFIQSHINIANDLKLFSNNDIPSISSKTYLILYIMVPLYVVVFIIISWLGSLSIIQFTDFSLINSYFNLITPFLFFAYYIFLLIKFSGRPYINNQLKNQISKILIIVVIWSIARFVSGLLGLIYSQFIFDKIVNEFQSKTDNVAFSIYVLIYFILLEYLPDFFALDYSLMMTYIKEENEKILIDEDVTTIKSDLIPFSESNRINNDIEFIASPSLTVRGKFSLHSGNESHRKTSYNTEINKKTNKDLIIKLNNVEILEMIFDRKNGLGCIYKGNYQSNEVTCRSIKFERLSRYDLESFSKDIDDIANINHTNVCPIIGFCVEKIPNILVIWPYFKSGSLYDFLHVNKVEIDLKSRMRIARNIAMGMDCLHDNKIFHSHLSSRNIYMRDDLTPVIADYGLHYLKDISSVFIKYKNKNSYTSPEILKETTKMISNTTISDSFQCDVYSFGIVLWELYTSLIPFNIKLTNLYTYVVVNEYRPEITIDFNPEIAALIRTCWDANPSKRPNFKQIIKMFDICISILK